MSKLSDAAPDTLSFLRKPGRSVPWFNVTAQLSTLQFGLLLGAMIVIAFPDIVFGGAAFVFRDYALFGYPLASYHRECFWRGEIPLWNPLNNSGLPYLAQWNTMVLYPLSAIYLLFPLPWSLGAFCLVHLFLGGLGMFVLARHWTRSSLAGGVAGVSFAFSGLMLGCLIWPNNIAALGLMPWVVFVVTESWEAGGKRLLMAAWIAALQMLAGAPEIFIFTWLALAALWLGRFWSQKENWKTLIWRAGTVVALMVGLVAAQLLPFLELLHYSHRNSEYGGLHWSMPPLGWVNFLVPLFRCTQTSLGVYLQSGQAWVSSYYLGIFSFILALTAAWRTRDRRVLILTGLLGLSLLLSLGEAGWIYKPLQRAFPLLGFMRFPIKWVVLAGLSVPLLAAFAVAHACNLNQPAKARENRRWMACSLAGAVCIIGFVLWFAGSSPENPDETPRNTLLWNGLSRAAFLAFSFLALELLARNTRPVLSVVLLAGIWLDGISHVPRQNPGVKPEAYTMQCPNSAGMKAVAFHGGGRVALSLNALERFHLPSVSNPLDFVLGVRMGLYDNLNLLEGIPKVDGFYSLYLPYEQDVRIRLFSSTNSVRGPLADFLGISQLTASNSLFEWEARPGFLPLITAGQKPEFLDSTNILGAMMEPAFSPREVVYLPAASKARISVSKAAQVYVVSPSFSSHSLRFGCQADQSGMVVVSQTYYPAWQAEVDGHQVPLLRANHAFQALQVPAGAHRVILTYRDRWFAWGMVISALTLLGTLLWWRFGGQSSVGTASA